MTIQETRNSQASGYIQLPDVTPRAFIFVPDADGIDGSWYLESTPNSPTPGDEDSTVEPLVSYGNETWDWERRTNGRPLNRPGVDHSAELSIEESGKLGNDVDVSTPNNSHAIDQQSSLWDKFDADCSGNVRTYSGSVKRDQEAGKNQFFLLDTGDDINTEIDMESSQALETGRDVQISGDSEAGNTGPLTGSLDQAEFGERNNLFFRTDDGRVLAVRISPTLGPELLLGLSQPDRPLREVPAPPFASTLPTAVDNDLAGDAQLQASTANASAEPSTTASDADRPANVSSNRPAPDPQAPSVLPGTLRPYSDAGIVDAGAWMHRIFSSEIYDRDWMSKHNVNDDILDGIPSKHKLNVFFKHGAVFVDDKLCVTYYSSGNPTVKEGEILPDSTSTNLKIRYAPPGTGAKSDGVISRVQGPTDLVKRMNEHYAKQYDGAVSEHWKGVRVVSSSGKEYGTLHDVRQAYQVWTDERAKWEAGEGRDGSG